MVFPIVMAASGAASAAATGLGLQLDAKSNDLTREVFHLQMRQSKRLFTAQWAQASYQYGEALAQSAQQHCEDMALSRMAVLQAEKINSQQMKLARDQDSRSYEMTYRTEVRESLRDELTNQFNRYNIVMLCDTVCLGCVYGLVVEGGPPPEVDDWILIPYLFCMGGSIMCFSVSLWFCVTIVRRLHEHTASIMERKLFSDDEVLQNAWHEEVENGLPTGPNVLHLVNQAYTRWLNRFISPLGEFSINMMISGVLMMFFCAGLLTHARYTIVFSSEAGVAIFWIAVAIATIAILLTKAREDSLERRKEGVFEKSYLDTPTIKGPMAKVKVAADELYTARAMNLGSAKRATLYREQERAVKKIVADNMALFERAEALRKNWEFRAKQRQDVLETLLAPVEEVDALPDDLMERVNKIISDVDEADRQTAHYVSMSSKAYDDVTKSIHQRCPTRTFGNLESMDMDGEDEGYGMKKRHLPPMPDRPIDAQHTPVSLASIRKKLGEIRLTTMIRIRNMTNEPLRLKSGVHLKAGNYIKDLEVQMVFDRYNRNHHQVGDRVVYHMFPIAEIPVRTEVVICARAAGTNWISTSGIDGELVYVNKSGTWSFHVNFSNGVGIGDKTTCKTKATNLGPPQGAVSMNPDGWGEGENSLWKISQETVDQKRNNEVLVQIEAMPPQMHHAHSIADLLYEGGSGEGFEIELQQTPSSMGQGPSNTGLMKGVLFEQVIAMDRRILWQQRWCDLSSSVFTVRQNAGATPEASLPLDDITKIHAIPDITSKHVFHVYSNGRKPIKLRAQSATDREQWIERIADATGRLYVADWGDIRHGESTDSEAAFKDGPPKSLVDNQNSGHRNTISELTTGTTDVGRVSSAPATPAKGKVGGEVLSFSPSLRDESEKVYYFAKGPARGRASSSSLPNESNVEDSSLLTSSEPAEGSSMNWISVHGLSEESNGNKPVQPQDKNKPPTAQHNTAPPPSSTDSQGKSKEERMKMMELLLSSGRE